jgi:biopolymer transport protein ExbB
MTDPAMLYELFREGGWGMYPLLVCWAVAVAITLERASVLFLRSSLTTPQLESAIKRNILAGDLRGAIDICAASRAPAARVVQAGLAAAEHPDRVQLAMDLAVLRETPRVARRTPYLAVTANLGVLLGLLGTVTGLTRGYCCHGGPFDPSAKARSLALGISEAMICTAFGLLIALLSLVAYACLNGRTKRLEDDMSYVSVHLVGLVVANRERLGLASAPEPIAGVRTPTTPPRGAAGPTI